MIKKYFNTNVLTAAKMLDVTDEKIIEWSSGKVTDLEDFNEDGTLRTDAPSLASEKIFGKLGEKSLKMGHIVSPIPLVNLNYLRGKRPVLPDLLHMDRKDVEDIVYSSMYIDPETKETVKHRDMPTPEASYLSGAAAIEKLLAKEGIPSDKIILHSLPVLPLYFRFYVDFGSFGSNAVKATQLEYLYFRFMQRINRYKKMCSLKVPKIIIENEAVCLQKYADAVICNGATAFPTSVDGYPLESLADFADKIENVNYKPVNLHDIYAKYSKYANASKLKELVYAYKDAVDSVYAGKNEYDPLSIEEHKKIGSATIDVFEGCAELIKNILACEFTKYQDYYDEMVIIAEKGIASYIDSVEDDYSKDEIVAGIAKTIYTQLSNFVKRRIQWYSLDKNLYTNSVSVNLVKSGE